jgi:site-specific recombinase XerD
MKPPTTPALALALHGFFTDYLPRQRALSSQTLRSYRDSLKLLLQFTAGTGGDPSRLTVEQLDVPQVTAFLESLETQRRNRVSTRNVVA